MDCELYKNCEIEIVQIYLANRNLVDKGVASKSQINMSGIELTVTVVHGRGWQVSTGNQAFTPMII